MQQLLLCNTSMPVCCCCYKMLQNADAALRCAALCCAVLCRAVLCCAVLCCAALHTCMNLSYYVAMQILDECHHCMKDSPYNHIMQFYKRLSEGDQAKTQVMCRWRSQRKTTLQLSLAALTCTCSGLDTSTIFKGLLQEAVAKCCCCFAGLRIDSLAWWRC